MSVTKIHVTKINVYFQDLYAFFFHGYENRVCFHTTGQLNENILKSKFKWIYNFRSNLDHEPTV